MSVIIDSTPGGFDQAQKKTAGGGFTGSAFAGQAEHLALIDMERDIIYRMDHLLPAPGQEQIY